MKLRANFSIFETVALACKEDAAILDYLRNKNLERLSNETLQKVTTHLLYPLLQVGDRELRKEIQKEIERIQLRIKLA